MVTSIQELLEEIYTTVKVCSSIIIIFLRMEAVKIQLETRKSMRETGKKERNKVKELKDMKVLNPLMTIKEEKHTISDSSITTCLMEKEHSIMMIKISYITATYHMEKLRDKVTCLSTMRRLNGYSKVNGKPIMLMV